MEDVWNAVEAQTPPRPQSLQEVVARGCCVGCGLCEGILGKDNVRMELVPPKNRLRPRFLQRAKAELERRALAACPGAVVRGPESDNAVPQHPIAGPVVRVRKGHAVDPEVRHKAAAGGGLTALAIHLVESGQVAFVLHVKASAFHRDEDALGARLSASRAEILAGCGSRYAPAAPLRSIGEVLDRGQRFALVGKPCDVNAMRNLALVDSRVMELCAFTLTISCGTYPDPDAAERFVAENNIAEAEVEEFRWRGHGCPGLGPYVRAKDGREKAMDYTDFWYKNGAEYGPLTFQWRCKTCPDFLGLQADVTVMDCWPGGQPEHNDAITDARRHEQDCWVLAVSRTPRGEQLLRGAMAAGVMALADVDVEEVVSTQPHQVARAVGLWARRAAHAAAGAPLTALDGEAVRGMLRAAFDASSIAVVLEGPHTGGARGAGPPPGCGPLADQLGAAGQEVLRTALATLGEGPRRFHEENYEGALWRLRRGDADERVLGADGADERDFALCEVRTEKP